MSKIALFVEGQTEQIFVREMLLRLYDYTNIGIKCLRLRSNVQKEASLSYPDKETAICQNHYYEIIDVGNDNLVLSAIHSHISRLYKAGFDKVIGLRDMYSEQYIKAAGRKINPAISERFINGSLNQIKEFPYPDIIRFFYAIMEVEAWFLGMKDLFPRIDAALTVDYIKEKTGIDLTNDPETTIYHPAKKISDILNLVGKTYDKKEAEVSSIVNTITKEDYLYFAEESPHCSAFKQFYKELMD